MEFKQSSSTVTDPNVAVGVLGPLQVRLDGSSVSVGGRKQKIVLAVLISANGDIVSTERLIDAVWGAQPPKSARKTLQTYIHRLRGVLGDRIASKANGYRIDLASSNYDVDVFTQLVERGCDPAVDPVEREGYLARALGLWRGFPFDDVPTDLLRPEVTRLTGMRMLALETRLELAVELGNARTVLSELEVLAVEYPTRERIHETLMLGLYLCGRQSESLRAYERARRFLAEEVGVPPSPRLQELADRVLQQDPTLVSSNRPAATSPSKQSIGGFEIRRRVDGTDNHYRLLAYQRSLGREVIIEVLEGQRADSADFVRSFEEDARRLAGLSHPHLLGPLDAWREPGRAIVVWPAGSVDQREIKIDYDPTGVGTVSDVASALNYLQQNGCVHGRIDQSAIHVDSSGRGYLAGASLRGLTRVSETDIRYRPPEQSVDRPLGAPADLWSFAVLIHDLFWTWPTDGKKISDSIPREVKALIDLAMKDDPQARRTRPEEIVRAMIRSVGGDVVPFADERSSPAGRRDCRNPYKGLRAFQLEDQADFFGRAALASDICDVLSQDRFVALVGPSGVGKSSLVRAGVVPELRRRAQNGPNLVVADMFPGRYPMEELESALLRIAVARPEHLLTELTTDHRGIVRAAKKLLPDDGTELVLVVDQFEEVYSLVPDGPTRSLFLGSLRAAVRDPDSRIRVLITLRADFFDKPLDDNEFGELLASSSVPISSPTEEELADAIVEPARAVGVALEPGLVSEIVHDVLDQPGGLPLLQHTLSEMFDGRLTDLITVDLYRESGRVFGSLGRTAESLWQGSTPEAQDAIRQVFLRLVTVNEGDDDVRRRVRRSELDSLDVRTAPMDESIQRFGARRLLSFDRDPVTRGPTVEVAHEALLREWPRLRDWIRNQREDLILHQRLDSAVVDWQTSGCDRSYLLLGQRLAQFELWEEASSFRLTAEETDFLNRSRQQRADTDELEARRARRLRRMLTLVSVLAIVAVIAGLAAAVQARRARSEAAQAVLSREEADSRRLALQAPQLIATDIPLALLVAVEAMRRDAGPASLGSLQQVLVDSGGFLQSVQTDGPTKALAIADDGLALVLTTSSLSEIRDGRLLQSVPIVGGTEFAVSSWAGLMAVADEGGVTLLAQETFLPTLRLPQEAQVTALEFNADGSIVGIGLIDGQLRLYEASSGVIIQTIDAHPELNDDRVGIVHHQPGSARHGTRAISFSDDGQRVATGGLIFARTWLVATGEKLDEFVPTRTTIDGASLVVAVDAVGFKDVRGSLLRVASTFSVHDRKVGDDTGLSTETEFPNRASVMSLTPVDGDVLVTPGMAVLADIGGTLTVLDEGREPYSVDAQLTGVPSLAVSPDGLTALIGGSDRVIAWALDGGGLIATPIEHAGGGELTFSEDGRYVTISSPDPTPGRLFDLSSGRPQPIPMPADAHFLILGPNDRFISLSYTDQTTSELWFDDPVVAGQALVTQLAVGFGFSPGLTALGLTPSPNEGALEVIVIDERAGSQETVHINLRDDLPSTEEWAEDVALSVSFSADQSKLVVGTLNGAAVVYDTASWEAMAVLSQGGGQVVIAEYSPDGRFLVTINASGEVLLRDPETNQPLGPPMVGLSDGIEGFSHGPAFSPDGRYMVTTAGGPGRIWDLEEGVGLGASFPNKSFSAGKSGNGLFLGTFDGERVVIWDLRIDTWVETACRAAGRNLTPDEWDQFGPRDIPFEPTCEMWS